MEKQRIHLSDHFTYGRLLKFVAPSILMFVVLSVYSVVDGWFISNFVGKVPFAAVNFIFPFLMMLPTAGFMLGTGGSALVAHALGEKKPEKANGLFSFFLFATIGIGAVLSVLSLIFMPQITRLIGCDDGMFNDCVLYGRILSLSVVPQTLHCFFESFIVTAEKPSLGLKVTVAAGLSNIVLDALFVAILDFGVAGAAVATVISQCVGGFVPLLYFCLPNNSLLRVGKTHFDGKALFRACTNGSSELMNNLSMSLVGMMYNVQLLRYFGENGVAAYGVIMYVNFIFIAAFIGYTVGSSPLVGYHFGAQNHAEMHNILKKSLIILAAGGLLMFAVAQLLALPIARLYVGYDDTLCSLTVSGFRIFALSFLLCGLSIFGSSFFTALGNGLISALIAFFRTLVFELGAVWLLPLAFGGTGIWFSVVVAETMAVFFSFLFLLLYRKKYGY